jgi:hypothetical protein
VEPCVVTEVDHPVVQAVEAWIAKHAGELPTEATVEVQLLRDCAERVALCPFTSYAATHKAFLASLAAVRAHLVVEDVEDPFDALTRRLSSAVRDAAD